MPLAESPLPANILPSEGLTWTCAVSSLTCLSPVGFGVLLEPQLGLHDGLSYQTLIAAWTSKVRGLLEPVAGVFRRQVCIAKANTRPHRVVTDGSRVSIGSFKLQKLLRSFRRGLREWENSESLQLPGCVVEKTCSISLCLSFLI